MVLEAKDLITVDDQSFDELSMEIKELKQKISIGNFFEKMDAIFEKSETPDTNICEEYLTEIERVRGENKRLLSGIERQDLQNIGKYPEQDQDEEKILREQCQLKHEIHTLFHQIYSLSNEDKTKDVREKTEGTILADLHKEKLLDEKIQEITETIQILTKVHKTVTNRINEIPHFENIIKCVSMKEKRFVQNEKYTRERLLQKVRNIMLLKTTLKENTEQCETKGKERDELWNYMIDMDKTIMNCGRLVNEMLEDVADRDCTEIDQDQVNALLEILLSNFHKPRQDQEKELNILMGKTQRLGVIVRSEFETVLGDYLKNNDN